MMGPLVDSLSIAKIAAVSLCDVVYRLGPSVDTELSGRVVEMRRVTKLRNRFTVNSPTDP